MKAQFPEESSAEGEFKRQEDEFREWVPDHAPAGRYERAVVGKGRFVYAPAWDVHQRWNFKDWFAIWPEVQPLKDRALFQRCIADAAGGVPLPGRGRQRGMGEEAERIEPVISTLDIRVRLEGRQKPCRSSLGKDHHGIHAGQGRQDLRPLMIRDQGAMRSFQPAH